jgi:hypothetical protein
MSNENELKGSKAKPLVSTPAAVFLRLFILTSFCWFTVPWLIGILGAAVGETHGKPGFAERAQLRGIQRRVHCGDAVNMNRFFPEGEFFSYSFYGFTLVNMALAEPDDRAFRQKAREELTWLIATAEKLTNKPPFLQNEHLTPKGGIIPAGQANLLRAGYIVLGGDRKDIIQSYHQASEKLFQAFQKSQNASVETYPNMIWPVDNCCGLESLHIHDWKYGTTYARACRRWEQWMDAHRDKESGMMVMQIGHAGETLDGPRGCGLSWCLAFMPTFAPNLSRSQYEKYRSEWFIHLAGCTAIREWVPGREGQIDSDTGPVIGPLGLAATGFGIAAAKAQGDESNLRGMLFGLELFGMPIWTPYGEKQYFFGAMLLPDVLGLWGKTLRPWTASPSQAASNPWPSADPGKWWALFLPALLIGIFMVWLPARSLRFAWQGLKNNPDPWRPLHKIVFAFDFAVLIAWALFTPVLWLMVVILMGLADILEASRTHSIKSINGLDDPMAESNCAGRKGSPTP